MARGYIVDWDYKPNRKGMERNVACGGDIAVALGRIIQKARRWAIDISPDGFPGYQGKRNTVPEYHECFKVYMHIVSDTPHRKKGVGEWEMARWSAILHNTSKLAVLVEVGFGKGQSYRVMGDTLDALTSGRPPQKRQLSRRSRRRADRAATEADILAMYADVLAESAGEQEPDGEGSSGNPSVSLRDWQKREKR